MEESGAHDVHYISSTQGTSRMQSPRECLSTPDPIQEGTLPQGSRNFLPTAKIFVRIPNHALAAQNAVQIPLQKKDSQSLGEIKSEPIKFELSEGQASETNANATFTPKEAPNDTDPNLISARPKNTVKCYKCHQCLFASVSEERLNQHSNTIHPARDLDQDGAENGSQKSKKLRKCPACDNEFLARRSLEVHLELDHEMPSSEIQSLVDDRSDVPQQQSPSEKPRTNRIFIKSVDVLRQPETSLSSSEHSQPLMSTFPTFQNSSDLNNTIFIDLINNDSPAKMISSTKESHLENSFEMQNLDTNDELVYHELQPLNTPKPPGKAKIYIKNVDILKEPIFVPPMSSFPSNILNVNDNLNLELLPDAYEYPSSLSVYDFNCNTDSLRLPSQAPPESTPKKLLNSLHLRTVDELNLMNMNEVQNLLAPLPEHNATTNNQASAMQFSENSKSSDEVLLLNSSTPYSIPDFPYNQGSFNLSESELMPGNWSYCYNFDDLDATTTTSMATSITTMTPIKPPQDLPVTSTHFELNTPQQVTICENDEDILFVCAQELINESAEKPAIEFPSAPFNQDLTVSESPQIEFGGVVEIEDDFEQQNQFTLEAVRERNTNAVQVGTQAAPIPEKGRIYVAGNLMEDRSEKTKAEDDSVKRGRGRPFGSRQIGITKLKKTLNTSTAEELGYHKCDLDCAYRFRDLAKLEYHKKCHTSSHLRMQCPECQQNDFCSWNTLHTHLWRQHKVDMELYSCELCSFKTPIYSRLMNTHIKIHSNDRNFKCDECDKAFKNSKQLKEHRRVHRSRNQHRDEAFICLQCNSTFGHQKSLKEHMKKKHSEPETGASERNADDTAGKNMLDGCLQRFQCDKCRYTTGDHNAFRRHKMTHDKAKKYRCQFCDYACIQSTVYQKHVQLKHPDRASEVVLKCSHCAFTTINRRNYDVHIAKHKSTIVPEPETNTSSCDIVDISLENCVDDPSYHTAMVLSNSIIDFGGADQCQLAEDSRFNSQQQFDHESSIEILELDRNNLPFEPDNRRKIKVKSDLVLTDPSKFCSLDSITLPYLGPL